MPCRVAVLSASRVVPSRSAREAGEARAADAAATQAPQLRLRVAELERELQAKHVSCASTVLGERQWSARPHSGKSCVGCWGVIPLLQVALIRDEQCSWFAWSASQRQRTHCLAVHLQVRLQEGEGEAAALKAALASAQKAAQQTERDPGPEAAASGSSASMDLQLKTAWDRANALKQRYLEAQAACTSFKQQNSKILQVGCSVDPTLVQSCLAPSLQLQSGVS